MKTRNPVPVVFLALFALWLPHTAAAQDPAQQEAPQAPQPTDPGTVTDEAQSPGEIPGLIGDAETLGEDILQAVEDNSGFRLNIFMRLGIAAAIIVLQALLMRLVWWRSPPWSPGLSPTKMNTLPSRT